MFVLYYFIMNKRKDKTFYIYKLYFDSSPKIYIGKTYDMAHRLADHIYRVNKGEKTPKANWIRKYIKTEELKHEILYTCKCEKEAYKKELELIRFYMNDSPIVNCQRLKEAGGIAGSIRPKSIEEKNEFWNTKAKEYMVITTDGSIEHVKGLSRYAIEHDLCYKALSANASGKTIMSQGRLVVTMDKWLSLSEEEQNQKIQLAKTHDALKTEKYLTSNHRLRKNYFILFKDTFEYIAIQGLTNYCVENGYNEGCMFTTMLNPNKWHKGVKVFKTEQELIDYKKDNNGNK